ncbi:hypothetical protein J6590_090890, partial [Homalodisca vitripennis]
SSLSVAHNGSHEYENHDHSSHQYSITSTLMMNNDDDYNDYNGDMKVSAYLILLAPEVERY